ncbi:MAG: hypothetical protein GIX03_00250 [Candidatus Eremiobacteraeota bacterium]|nr:hypothetical protein [Candidatus Eremiobacteraeota bacterium]MBC5801453.1 hypothetical protein [Candidatus Eremiobacteraeota bacterium]MBC5822072.1 hypothetical protein [Candidatus Eremiobacteraeota bacterium]
MLHVRVLATLLCALVAATAANAAPRPFRAVPPSGAFAASGQSVIASLRISTIGSTVDASNGDQNPYGLTIAPAGDGKIAAGDLVLCNFNDGLNIQGLGTTIEVLKPYPGATPRRLIADPRLTGCAAIAMGGAAPWVAALDANDNPIVSPTGKILDPLNTFAWTGPWGQAFVAGPHSPPAFYESNANDGSIVRINLSSPFTFEKIATGFPVNHGVPGSILAPSGLTYDAVRDVLYIVDGDTNSVFEIREPARVHTGGIAYTPHGFIGPAAGHGRLLHAGNPLNAPISAALLFNGDLVVGNTGDNRLVELSPAGSVLGTRLVDAGTAGALFGIAASGTSADTTRVYFNDDNDNTVKRLAH